MTSIETVKTPWIYWIAVEYTRHSKKVSASLASFERALKW